MPQAADDATEATLSRVIGAFVVFGVAALAVGVAIAVSVQKGSAPAAKKSFYDYSAAVGNILPVGGSPPIDARLLAHGQWVYRGMCIGCHGVKGDGNGGVWTLSDKYGQGHKLPRQPRDFTAAVYKIRSTPSGSLPIDNDLFSSISRGLVADQDMPAFKFLPERDRWAVLAYIKSLSKRWEEEKDYQQKPIEVGEVPLPDAAALVAGKEVYARMQCEKCHGPTGLGDGPSAPELMDDNGLPIKPRNFGMASQFVGASDPRGVYQTFITGIDGTPMPSYSEFLKEDQRWQLVWYVMSFRGDWSLEKMRQEVALARTAKTAPAAGGASK